MIEKVLEKTELEKKFIELRKDFPILNRKVNEKNLVYFDNAATSQKPNVVIDSIKKYFEEYNSNVHRVGHTLGQEASVAYEQGREKVSNFINAKIDQEIIFTSNATEAINLVAWSWGRNNINEGDEILISIMEHHSNFIPWQQLAKEKNAVLKVIDIDSDYQLDMNSFKSLITDKTKIVAITMMSNVLGTITPIKEICEIAHKYNSKVLVDASQSITQMKINVQELDCDFMVFTGHKMCAPTGIGVLYGKYDILDSMPPFLMGGGMITTVSVNESHWEGVPQRFEAGTPKISEVIGLGKAIDYLNEIGIENIRKYEKHLTKYLINKLLEIESLKIYGTSDIEKRGSAVSFTIGKIHPHDIGSLLDEFGIAVRIGHHCAMPLHEKLSIDKSIRASLYFYNTIEEIDYFINSLKKAVKMFNKFI
ncbi:MAG: cysteine desulfurase [Candidatus Sericytochromatia bacterium]